MTTPYDDENAHVAADLRGWQVLSDHQFKSADRVAMRVRESTGADE
jgi:hypothetical protein